MKTIQLLKWEAIALVESKDDYKEERKKKREDPGKIKKKGFLPTTRPTCPTKLRCWSKEDERCLEQVM